MSRMGLVGKGQLSLGQEQDGRSEVKEGFKDAWNSPGALWSPQEPRIQFLDCLGVLGGGLGVSIVLGLQYPLL